jgi:phage recombination protein Bet
MEKTNKELIAKEQSQELAKILTPEVIKKYICPNATQQEIFMFLQIAKMYQLNPFKREIYLVKYEGYPAQNVVGYETYLKRAARTGEWTGMRVWTDGKIPELIAKIEINKKGWDKPFYHEVDYTEYVQHKKDGTITKFWKEKPKTMLKKVVVSQAFRMAFPDEFGGMPYTVEEMPIEIEKLSTEVLKTEDIVSDALNIPEEKIEEVLSAEAEKALNMDMPDVIPDTPPTRIDQCEKCQKALTPKVYKYSHDKFGKGLCFDCQKVAK